MKNKLFISLCLIMMLSLGTMLPIYATTDAGTVEPFIVENGFTETVPSGEITPYGTSAPTEIYDLSTGSLNVKGSMLASVYSNFKFKPVDGQITIDGTLTLRDYATMNGYNVKLCDTNILGSDKVVYSSDNDSDFDASFRKTIKNLNNSHYYYLYISKTTNGVYADIDIIVE